LENIAPQSAQKNINLEILRPLPFPDISFSDQQNIVTKLTFAEKRMEAMLERQQAVSDELNALLPSVMDKAFRGEL
jgi:type I restriction enzyme, S subunit